MIRTVTKPIAQERELAYCVSSQDYLAYTAISHDERIETIGRLRKYSLYVLE